MGRIYRPSRILLGRVAHKRDKERSALPALVVERHVRNSKKPKKGDANALFAIDPPEGGVRPRSIRQRIRVAAASFIGKSLGVAQQMLSM